MAKAAGIVNIEGTVENLTFFKKDGKNFVRRKGGVSQQTISHIETNKTVEEEKLQLVAKALDVSVEARRFQVSNAIFKTKIDLKLCYENSIQKTQSKPQNRD